MMSPNKRTTRIRLAALLGLLLGIFIVQEVEAQRGGRGGGARGGGHSRQGAAASGSFSGAGRTQRAAPTADRQAASSSRQETRQGTQAQRQESRTARAETRGGTQAQRQESRTERAETRQEGATARTEERREGYYAPRAGYYPDYGDDWDDDWDVGAGVVGLAAGAVVGAAVADGYDETVVVTAPSPVTTLPCSPSVTTVEGTTYYRCADSYYMQSYGSDGPTYMPVAPP